MAFSASDVMKLRAETDAPLMECKAALAEADGDFEKAKALLREKGKAAAAKRADRSTAAGVVAWASSSDGKTVGGVVLESETDFVAKNESFIAIAQQLAEIFRDNDPGQDPYAISADGTTVRDIVEQAVGKIRENIQVTRAVRLTGGSPIATYVHHDRTKGAAVELSGDATNALDAGFKVAVQTVSNPPQFIAKDEVPQEKIDAEMEIEVQRALNEGKPENIAKNIAMGRINKEYLKQVVLLEQPFYADAAKSVAQYLQEEAKAGGGSLSVRSFTYLAVGGGS